jgi:rSAM/selenodomain-associated transferase 1
MSDYICLYAKPPIPGRTKTRLAREIGKEEAAALSCAMLLDLYHQAIHVPHAQVSLWHPPDSCPEEFAYLMPCNISFHSQHGTNLGERMSDTFATLLKGPSDRVIIIGSDCITHDSDGLQKAFSALSKYPVVLQPAIDGGYVLVGQSRYCPQMFVNIPWGSERVMELTRKCLQQCSIPHYELPETFDIDTPEDLLRLKVFLEKHERAATRKWLGI